MELLRWYIQRFADDDEFHVDVADQSISHLQPDILDNYDSSRDTMDGSFKKSQGSSRESNSGGRSIVRSDLSVSNSSVNNEL